MVPHLLKAGFEVFVCDPDSDAVAAVAMHGAARCETPRHVADNADIVLVCIPTPDIVEQVVLGDTGIRHGQRVGVIVDHSTTGPSVARKLVNNMIVASTLTTTCEAVLAGIKSGLDAQVLLDMLNASTACSFTSEAIVSKTILERQFDFGFPRDLMRKDLRLFLSEAETVGVPSFAASVSKQFFDRAVASVHGAEDMTRVAQELEILAAARIERVA